MCSAQSRTAHLESTRRLVIALSLFITQAFGATYYVSSSSGSDSNTGTSITTPWKTISKVDTKVLVPGDFVLFKAGDTWIGSNFSKTLSTPSAGISGKQITYGSYGSGAAPILDGNNSVGTAVRISRNYITINGFQIRNVTGVLIDYTGTTGTNILNIAGKNAGVWGYRAGSGAGNTLIDHTSCSVDSGHSMRGWCYQAVGTGSIKLTHNTCDFSLTNTGACMEIFGSSTSVIQYNTAHGGSQAFSLKPMGGSLHTDGTGCTGPAQTGGLIADNYADGISSANGDGEAIELTGCSNFPQRGVTVTRNVVICKGGGAGHGTIDAIGSFYSTNGVITGNVIIGDCGAYPDTAPNLMHLSSYSSGMLVYNNTLYGSGRSDQIAVNLMSGSSVTVKNNIIGKVGVGIYNQGSSASSEDYNIYMANVRTPYSRVSAGGHSKRATDPKFMVASPVGASDVKVQATSPAIRAGANLGSSFSSILNPLGVVSPFGIFDQSLGWMVGAFGYAVPAATPTFIPPGGAYSSAQSVSILDSSVGATIYYTTNGTTPTISSSVYRGPIAVSATTTIKALAVGGALSASGVGSATYTIQ
ncbi:MAG: chitobiase/beta-hexosaminidase C-terminal domain-containing protein [Bryobacteraceae bacterium]